MAEQHIDLLVLLGSANQEYVGVTRPYADAMRVHYEPVLVLFPDIGDPHVWTMFPEGVSEPATVSGSLPIEYPDGVVDLVRAIRDLGQPIQRIGIDELTSPMLGVLDHLLCGVELLNASVAIAAARMVKTSDEIECLRTAQLLTEQAMAEVQPHFFPGSRQNELSAKFFRRAFELGMTWSCIDPIWSITATEKARRTSTVTGGVGFPLTSDDRFFAEGDLVMSDVGLVWNGYHSDFGKTWLCSHRPSPSPALRECFERWQAVMETVYASLKPGRTCADIAREVALIEPSHRLPQFYLAHGLGCDSAEMPFIGSELGPQIEDSIELVPDTVIVFEPVIWVDGVGGYRSEELTVVTEDGYERLSTYGYWPFEGVA